MIKVSFEEEKAYPLVTVVTPSFNQGKYIEATINSVLSQNYPKLEYLVFDGGSTDSTIEVLQQYEQKLSWVSEKDRGQSDAVNKGFRAAKGEILGWLNSDDTYEPEAINNVVRFFIEHPDVDMVYGKGAHIHENGEFMEWYPTEPFNMQRLAETCFICQPAVFLRARIFEKMDMLNIELNYSMDYDLWMRIAKQFKMEYLPVHIANTRLYEDTKTLSKRVEAHAEIIETVKNHYGTVPPSWIYSYSRYVLERRLTHNTRSKNIVYRLLFTIMVLSNIYRVNGFRAGMVSLKNLFRKTYEKTYGRVRVRKS